MKLISWNVNGLRACLKKGFEDVVRELDADFFCIQETKMQEGQATLDLPEYEEFFCSAERKGYSGTAVLTKKKPLRVQYNFGEHTDEGRGIILEYEDFYLVNVYVPNSQNELRRLDYRMKWEDDIRNLLVELDREKTLAQGARIIEGDIFSIDDARSIRHDALQTAFLIFSYLMEK